MRYTLEEPNIKIPSKLAWLMQQRRQGTLREWYTPPQIVELSDAQRSTLTFVKHRWNHGDRLYKLAQKHYNNPEAWWIIALYNKFPTEAHIPVGSMLVIPLPVGRLLAYWGY